MYTPTFVEKKLNKKLFICTDYLKFIKSTILKNKVKDSNEIVLYNASSLYKQENIYILFECCTNYKSYGKIILNKFYEILVNQNKTFYFYISIYIMKGN